MIDKKIFLLKFEIAFTWSILDLEYKLMHQNNLNKFCKSDYDNKNGGFNLKNKMLIREWVRYLVRKDNFKIITPEE